MAKIYARLIKTGAINPKTNRPYTINDVPENLREEVERLLGYTEPKSGNLVKDITQVK